MKMSEQIKFQHKGESDFFNHLQKKVNAFFKERGIAKDGGIKLITKSVFLIILFITPYIVVISHQPGSVIAVLLLIMMGIGKAGVGMSIMHDALHGSFSKKKWVNNLFGGSLYLLGGNPVNWQIQHNVLHHTYPNIYKVDEDVSTKAYILRLSPESELHHVHKYQWLYILPLYALMTLSFMVKDFRQLYRYNKSGETRRQQRNPSVEMFKLTVAKILYLGTVIGVPWIFTQYSFAEILIGFLIVHFTAGLILTTVFQLAHVVEGVEYPERNVNGDLNTSWAIHQLATTSNFSPKSRFIHWFTGGLNFQVEHHLFPHISHIHYRSIAPLVKETAREFGIAYHSESTLWSALISHLRMLKVLGRKEELEMA